MIKKLLYLFTGLSWGICTANEDIMWYAILLTILTIVFEIILDDSEE